MSDFNGNEHFLNLREKISRFEDKGEKPLLPLQKVILQTDLDNLKHSGDSDFSEKRIAVEKTIEFYAGSGFDVGVYMLQYNNILNDLD